MILGPLPEAANAIRRTPEEQSEAEHEAEIRKIQIDQHFLNKAEPWWLRLLRRITNG